MSFDGIMLVIATDNRREGLRFVLGVYLDQCPKWCLVTDDPKVIRAIPDGMPCIGRWIARHPSLAELAWRERQADGKSSGVSEKMMDRIADWRRRHEARERAIAFAHLKNGVAALEGEQPDHADAPEVPSAAVIEARPAAAVARSGTKSGGSKWR